MKSLNTSQNAKFTPTSQLTIAQLNKVSIKESKSGYEPDVPFRIRLPEYFNIPTFKDKPFIFNNSQQNKAVSVISKQDAVFKKRMKDLTLLAEGMKRAKNIKQESRYYFTQGVLLHNSEQYLKSIEYFEKFLKIVLYLEDAKSTELALNVIGCAYMYLGDYQKAIQFHNRQERTSNRADRFMSSVNKGLCYQLRGNIKQAYSLYQQAEMTLEMEDNHDQRQRKQQTIFKIIQRLQSKLREQQLFMTENYRGNSPGKSVQSSILKQQSSLLLKKSVSRKQYEHNKLKYAIHAAEQNIQQQIKSSIRFEPVQ